MLKPTPSNQSLMGALLKMEVAMVVEENISIITEFVENINVKGLEKKESLNVF